ncbi:MAG: hypothetical protein K1000chlam4_00643 [Chlamydiae bacterium]|nr:hypothetical protein [Chlamydiota bacterium]
MESSASMSCSSSAASVDKLVEQNSSQKSWSCEAKVGIAVAAIFVLLGATALIIPNFVAVSSLPMPIANLRTIGILVAFAGVALGLIISVYRSRSQTRDDDGVSKTSSGKSDAEIGDLDAPTRAAQSSSEDEISDETEAFRILAAAAQSSSEDEISGDEGGTSSESGEYMHTPPSAEPKDRGERGSSSGKRTLSDGSLIDVPPGYTPSVPDGGFEFETGETDPFATRDLTNLSVIPGEIGDQVPGEIGDQVPGEY